MIESVRIDAATGQPRLRAEDGGGRTLKFVADTQDRTAAAATPELDARAPLGFARRTLVVGGWP